MWMWMWMWIHYFNAQGTLDLFVIFDLLSSCPASNSFRLKFTLSSVFISIQYFSIRFRYLIHVIESKLNCPIIPLLSGCGCRCESECACVRARSCQFTQCQTIEVDADICEIIYIESVQCRKTKTMTTPTNTNSCNCDWMYFDYQFSETVHSFVSCAFACIVWKCVCVWWRVCGRM